MAFLSFLYKYGLWISVPIFALCVVLLVLSITGVVRLTRQSRLLSVAVAERQEIEFSDAGRVVLCTESPILSRKFYGLKFELVDKDGRLVSSRPVIFRARTTGFTTARMESRIFYIESAGRYQLHVIGLADAKPLETDHSIVFMRPHLGQSILYVIGIVLTAGLTIGSIVLFLLRLLNVK